MNSRRGVAREEKDNEDNAQPRDPVLRGEHAGQEVWADDRVLVWTRAQLSGCVPSIPSDNEPLGTQEAGVGEQGADLGANTVACRRNGPERRLCPMPVAKKDTWKEELRLEVEQGFLIC